MGSIGLPELLVVLAIILLLFGAQKLPEIARSLKEAVNEFQRTHRSEDDKKTDQDGGPPPRGNE